MANRPRTGAASGIGDMGARSIAVDDMFERVLTGDERGRSDRRRAMGGVSICMDCGKSHFADALCKVVIIGALREVDPGPRPERAPQNGPYRGTASVRRIRPGISGRIVDEHGAHQAVRNGQSWSSPSGIRFRVTSITEGQARLVRNGCAPLHIDVLVLPTLPGWACMKARAR